MGVTDKGYTRRSYDEILNGKIAKARELFGEDIDTGEHSAMGKFIRINAYDQALQEETMELIYYSRYPDTATGVSLDRIADFAGIMRNPSTAAGYRVELMGEPGHIVEKGFLVGTESQLNYSSQAPLVLDEKGRAEGIFYCTINGSMGNADSREINTIVNPDARVSSMQCLGVFVPGEDTESDFSLRRRIKSAIQGAGSTNENAVRAALLRVPTVVSAGVIVNNEDVADDKGRPPHSFECFVTGGEQHHRQIAEAIFEKKPLGIKSHGRESVDIVDSGGFIHSIKFSHSTNVPVQVWLSLRKNPEYTATGEEEIAYNLSEHINSLGLGVPLIYSALFGHVYKVPGVEELMELKLSTDSGVSFITSNISPEPWEIMRCEKVVVSYAT